MPELITDDQLRELEALAGEYLSPNPVHELVRAPVQVAGPILYLAQAVPSLLHEIAMSRQSEAHDQGDCGYSLLEGWSGLAARLRAEVAHEREITDKAIARAEKAEAAIERVRQVLAEHPGSAWDSGIKLQVALKAALDGE